MKTILLLSSVLGFTLTGCASEKLRVTVVDDTGAPVSNATVRVGFSTSHVLFGGGHSSHDKGGHAMSKTDTNGVATVKFNCTSSDFGWRVVADGYYRGDLHNEHFKFDEIVVPPCFGKVVLHEHEKSGNEKLFRIKNPQPMYAHYPIERRRVPKTNGRYGFDLAEYDWLPPVGAGKVADFYLVRAVGDIPDSGQYEFGRIEFDKDCSYYVGKQTGCTEFPATYHADPNAFFQTNIVLKCIRHRVSRDWVEPLPILGNDEYLVLRTRVVHDENGNIVTANYSRILGEFRANPSISTAESIFNPVPNDTNLEFDKKRNLYKGRGGRIISP